jgi:2-polyprenyl-6-methoxyphenol hydroxylase-like FAD-dependent oxidoreductase
MLSDVIENALINSVDIGSNEVLDTYQKSIEKDQSQTMNYTDDLMSWFKIDRSIVASIRSLGMLVLDQTSVAKKALFSRVSGYRGNTPKLLRVPMRDNKP